MVVVSYLRGGMWDTMQDGRSCGVSWVSRNINHAGVQDVTRCYIVIIMLITMSSRDISDIPNWMLIQLLAPFIRYAPPLPHRPRCYSRYYYGHESAAEPAQPPELRLHLHYPFPRQSCRKTLTPCGQGAGGIVHRALRLTGRLIFDYLINKRLARQK